MFKMMRILRLKTKSAKPTPTPRPTIPLVITLATIDARNSWLPCESISATVGFSTTSLCDLTLSLEEGEEEGEESAILQKDDWSNPLNSVLIRCRLHLNVVMRGFGSDNGESLQ